MLLRPTFKTVVIAIEDDVEKATPKAGTSRARLVTKEFPQIVLKKKPYSGDATDLDLLKRAVEAASFPLW